MRWRHKDSKGGKSGPQDRGTDVYAGLREQILRLDPATAGMSQRPGGPIV